MENPQARERSLTPERQATEDGRLDSPSFAKSTIREYFESIVIAVILALFIRTFARPMAPVSPMSMLKASRR